MFLKTRGKTIPTTLGLLLYFFYNIANVNVSGGYANESIYDSGN